MKLWSAIFSFSLLLTACSGGSDGAYSYTPDLDFECAFVDAMGCDDHNSGKPVFIGLHESTGLRCGPYMALLTSADLTLSFDYSSRTQTTTSYGSGILSGVATHWVNSQQMPVVALPEKTYKLCAFIDANSNGRLDVQEPLLESTFAAGGSYSPLSNWTDY